MNNDDGAPLELQPVAARLASARIDRRLLLKVAGAGMLNLESLLSGAADSATTDATQAGGEYLFRGGHVLLPSSQEELPQMNVLVRDGIVVAVGTNISAPAAKIIDARDMIVMPGFVDTHWHLWNTVLRNMQRPGFDYFEVKAAFVEHFTPEHVYRSNRLALAEAVNAGITTVNNFAHNIRSPAHADAELRAMAESGIRGRFSYGWRDPTARGETADLKDIRRVQQEWFGPKSPFEGRVHLGMALRGPKYADDAVVAREFQFAAESGLPVSLHTGASARPGQAQSVARLCAAGYIKPQTILVHWIGQDDADLHAALRSGASISLSPTSDLRTPYDASFHDALFMLRNMGTNLCLSIDSALLAGVSMFEQMATTWYVGVPWDKTPTEHAPSIDFQSVLKMATVNGARALGLEPMIGSLEPGKRADLLLVRSTDLNMAPMGNSHAALARTATPANVDTVMIDGRILKQGGRLLGVNVRTIIAEAESALQDLRLRAGGMWAPRT